MITNKDEQNLLALGADNNKKSKRGKKVQSLPKIQINKPEVDWRGLWESDDVRKRVNLDTFEEQTPSQSRVKKTNSESNYNQPLLWNHTATSTDYFSKEQKKGNSELWGNQIKSSSSSPLQNYSTIETDYSGYISSKKKAKAKDQKQMSSSITDLYPSLNGGTLEGYPEMNISGSLYTNGYDYYHKDKMLRRIFPANKDGSLISSWDTADPYIPWVTKLEENLKAGKPMPEPTAFNLSSATDSELEFHSTLSDIYSANRRVIDSEKRRKAEAEELAAAQTNAQTTTAKDEATSKSTAKSGQTHGSIVAQNSNATLTNTTENGRITPSRKTLQNPSAPRGNMPYPAQESAADNSHTNESPLSPDEAASYISSASSLAKKEAANNRIAIDKINQSKERVGNPSSSSSNIQKGDSRHTYTNKPTPIGTINNNQEYKKENDIPKDILANNQYIMKVIDSKGNYLLALKGNKDNHGTITAKELYKRGGQWFEPSAINYRKKLHINPNITNNSGIKHFTSKDIQAFADKYNLPWDYIPRSFAEKWEALNLGEGDWKASSEGADGYLLSTVDGELYWSDAIGQAPFAINSVRDLRKILPIINKIPMIKNIPIFNKTPIESTEEIGKYEGRDDIGLDSENNYDNAVISRVSKWENAKEVFEDKAREATKENFPTYLNQLMKQYYIDNVYNEKIFED